MSVAHRIPVHAERDYDVLIGTDLGGQLPALLGAPCQVLVITQAALAGRAAALRGDLEARGFTVLIEQVPDGEAAKTAAVAAGLWDVLGAAAFTRSDAVVGLGGGAATDLAGFVAATWLRGVRVVQVPTTLLAMVDAAVGGKTGINTPAGKNLVGSFHSPVGVLADLGTLTTLPAEDLRAGLAEIVKCGFIADPEILALVEADPDGARTPGSATLTELVRRAVQVKADVVSADLREADLREILNYGHTLAHAIERTEDYRWRHGDAVAVGTRFAAELAGLAGRLAPEDVDRHRRVLTVLGLPTTYRGDRWAELHDAMRRDKKSRGATLRFVVLDAIGAPGRLEGPAEDLLEAAYARISEEHA